MSERNVTRTGKDHDGDITRLCKAGEPWSPRSKDNAISDIETRTHQYWVENRRGGKTYIHVTTRGGRKYLRTDPNDSTCDNLDLLPDC